jgi:serine/threonine protein kinase/tetratricopeptide (TPR) repeat protein
MEAGKLARNYPLAVVAGLGRMTITQGTQFGPYRILEQIGSGGMGDVYRAQDTRLGREVAIKLISERYLAEAFGSGSASPAMGGGTPATPGTLSQRRFLREAQAASVLNHANICTIYDIGEQGGRPYLVMELLRGKTLKETLRQQALSAGDVITLSRQMASALAAAHAQGVVHRDIKPANIFVVGPEGKRQIKILDFGLAKQEGAGDAQDSGEATATFAGQATSDGSTFGAGNGDLTSPGSTLGTVAYMSPEQAEGQALDARTDLFSLGAVAYEMATGKAPFAGGSTAAIFAALLTKEPPPVSAVREQEGRPPLPAGFDAIVTRLLAKDKSQRYQRATEVERELDELDATALGSGTHAAAGGGHATHDGASTSAWVPPAAEDLRPTESSRGGRGKVAAAVVIVLLLAAAGFAWWQHKSAGPTKNANGSASGNGPSAEAAKNAIIVADFINQTGDTVFESTLNQALVVQLGQSPVLDIVSQRHLHQSLQYLGKKPDTVITPEIAREIGEREGIKAILTGTIANLGNDFVVTLAAQNTATGDQIASVQAQAASKEKVLDALNQAATQMRAKLGESLDSIQKLNAPFGQATTPSLEAFRAFALGDAAHDKGSDIPEAEDHYKRALMLDPNLAMAWARLGVISLNSGQHGKAVEYFTKAHELTGDVSERERLYIEGHYYGEVLGELDKAIETLEVATQEYPLQMENHINLAVFYAYKGEVEKTLDVTLKALSLRPDDAVALADVIGGYTWVDQYDEARKYVARANQLGMHLTDILQYEMALDGATGDLAAIRKKLTEGAGRPDQFQLTWQWGNIQAEWGQFRAAAATLDQAAEQAGRSKAADAQASFLMNAPYAGWPVGECQDAESAVKRAQGLDRSKSTQISVAATLALCGDQKPALAALDALEKRYPGDTLVQQLVVPEARGYLELQTGDARKALALLQQSEAFDAISPGSYLRGLAYLQLHDADNAVASFKAGTRYKGTSYLSQSALPFPLNNYALAMLGLGRGYAMAGDKGQAKKAYEAFFAEWKNADADLAVMAAAKKEYAGL